MTRQTNGATVTGLALGQEGTTPLQSRLAEQAARTPATRLHADDAALIERSWHEPEAFAGLYDRHPARIHRYVTRRLGSQVADDLVGETFLCAFRRRRRYDLSPPDAGPRLYHLPANLVRKHRRAAVRLLRALARTGPETGPA